MAFDFNVFKAVFIQLLCMAFFMLIGYFLCRKKVISETADTMFSAVLINVFMPLTVFGSLSTHLTVSNAKEKLTYFFVSVPVLLITIVAANILSGIIAKDNKRKNMLVFAFAFNNFGYIGYPVIEAVFGSEMLANFIIYVIPLTIALYTYGMDLFSEKSSKKWYLRLITPVTVSIVFGAVFGLSGIKLPSFAEKICSMGNGCLGTTAMLLMGISLAKCDIKKLLLKKQTYFIVLIKSILLPAILFSVLYLFNVRGEVLLCAVAAAALPIGQNIVIFSVNNGLEQSEPLGYCMITSAFSIFIIPVFLSVATTVM